MTIPGRTFVRIGLYASFYLAVLAATNELRLSSSGLRFFSLLWLVQSAAELWQTRRSLQNAR